MTSLRAAKTGIQDPQRNPPANAWRQTGRCSGREGGTKRNGRQLHNRRATFQQATTASQLAAAGGSLTVSVSATAPLSLLWNSSCGSALPLCFAAAPFRCPGHPHQRRGWRRSGIHSRGHRLARRGVGSRHCGSFVTVQEAAVVAATYPRHGEVEMCARADGGPRGRPPLGTLVAGLVGLLVVEGDVGHRLACHMSFPPSPRYPLLSCSLTPHPPPLLPPGRLFP